MYKIAYKILKTSFMRTMRKLGMKAKLKEFNTLDFQNETNLSYCWKQMCARYEKKMMSFFGRNLKIMKPYLNLEQKCKRMFSPIKI